MRVYTTYFSRVPKVPEDIIPVAISLSVPPGWEYPRGIALAPPYVIFNRYKRSGNFDEFSIAYCEQVLRNWSAQKIVSYLSKCSHGKDCAMVCWEKDWHVCHRGLVAHWLEYNDIPCEEL